MFGKLEHEHFILWYTYLHQIIIIAHFCFSFTIYFSLSRLKNTQPFFQLALEWIKLLLRRTKRGKKDPEMTKETAVHPFLVVCNKLSCQYHWNLISRVSFKENWNDQLSGPSNQKLNIGMGFHKHNPLLRNQAYN